MSRRSDILQALKDRVSAINGGAFQTTLGQTIFLGETPDLGPDDPDAAIVIAPGDEEVRIQQGGKLFIAWPISIQAVAKAELQDGWLTIEAVVSDIKKAVELSDRTLGGLVEQHLQRGATRTLPREPGSLTIGASVLYVANYSETWGAP